MWGTEVIKSNRKRSLVSGGAGFLGSHLCDSLIADGHDVLCVDNLYTGFKSNISHLEDNPNFEFLHHDVVLPLLVDVDEIYNLACPASPIHYQSDPIQTMKTSIYGAMNLLDLAQRLNCKILQASTSEVYGDPTQHPQSEEYWGNVNPIGPRSCYDEGKRCAETLFADYHRQMGLEIKVARIFNTYGPRIHQSDGRVVSNFIVQALSGRNVTIYGDGTQSRSFCYVADLVLGLRQLMNTPPEIYGPVNLGTADEHTVSELADLIIKLTGSNALIEYQNRPEDDPQHRKPDLTLAQQVLSWNPTVDLSAGLSKTIHYFRSVLAKK